MGGFTVKLTFFKQWPSERHKYLHYFLCIKHEVFSCHFCFFGSHKCHVRYRLNILSFICNKAEVPFMKVYNARRITPCIIHFQQIARRITPCIILFQKIARRITSCIILFQQIARRITPCIILFQQIAKRITPCYLLKAILLEWRNVATSLNDCPM